MTKYTHLTEELSYVKSRHATCATFSDDLMSVRSTRARSAKRAKRTQLCHDGPATALKAAVLALLSERDDFKNCCETLRLENRCISGVAADAKTLREKLAGREKTGAAEKTFRTVGRGSVLLLPIDWWSRLRWSSRRQRMDIGVWLILPRIPRLTLLVHDQT